MGFGAIGYLNAMNDPDQKQTSSVGMTYIAMPRAASLYDGQNLYILFLVFMFMTGITQVYAFVLGFITNLTDYFGIKAWQAGIPVTLFGIGYSVAFTSNSGWILFDMTEHFILRYIVIMVGFLQCVSVGWYFEYFTTAAVSSIHRNSLRALALFYWIPCIVITFYANFGLESNRMYGLLLVCPFTLLSLIVSFIIAKDMGFNSWYHEIVLQGVDKLSMSITSLSNENARRSFWMLPFETYFGIFVKFVNPACLLFIFFHNLYEDLTDPYGDNSQRMFMFATVPVFISFLLIFIPIFTCGAPEKFMHDVNKEFMADVLYELNLRIEHNPSDHEIEL